MSKTVIWNEIYNNKNFFYFKDSQLLKKSNYSYYSFSLAKIIYPELSYVKFKNIIKFMEKTLGIKKGKSILDFGSGLNYKRKGLNELLELICKNCVDKVVVFYSDRLMRFGFDMFLALCKIYDTEVIIVDKTENEKTDQQEFAEDLISIVHYFSMKLYGSRSYKQKSKQNEND